METILKSILLMSLCSSATVPAMAINGADNNKEKSSIHDMETSDSIKHQPLTESSVKLNEVVVTGLTGSQKLKQSPAPISFVSAHQLEMQPSTNIIDAYRSSARRFTDYHGKRNLKARDTWIGI